MSKQHPAFFKAVEDPKVDALMLALYAIPLDKYEKRIEMLKTILETIEHPAAKDFFKEKLESTLMEQEEINTKGPSQSR